MLQELAENTHLSEQWTMHLVLFSTRNNSPFFLRNNRLLMWIHQIIVYSLKIHLKCSFLHIHPISTSFSQTLPSPSEVPHGQSHFKSGRREPNFGFSLWRCPGRALCPLFLQWMVSSALICSCFDGLSGESANHTILFLFPQQVIS